MEPIVMIGAIAILAGAAFAVVGILGATGKLKNKFLKTKIGAGVVGIVIVAAGVVMGGWPGIVEGYNSLTNAPAAQSYTYTYTSQQQQTQTGYGLAQFDIVPTAFSAGNLSLNGAKTVFTLPAQATITSHVIKTLSNATFVQPSMRFVLNPKAWEGSNALSLATVYFEVTPGQQYISPAAGNTYKYITETDGIVNIRFNNSGNTISQRGSGQLSCLLTGSIVIYVNMTLNSDSCSRIDNTYDPINEIITFHNADNSWSQSFTLTFFITQKIAG